MIDYDEISEQLGPDIANALRVLAAQRAKGIPKYGCGIEGNTTLTTRNLVQHAREELADGLVYLSRLDRMHADELAECRRETIYGLTRELREVLQSVEGNSDEFKLMAVQNWIGSYRPFVPYVLELYAQPSVVQHFIDKRTDLLEVSRNGAFPFTRKLEVRL